MELCSCFRTRPHAGFTIQPCLEADARWQLLVLGSMSVSCGWHPGSGSGVSTSTQTRPARDIRGVRTAEHLPTEPEAVGELRCSNRTEWNLATSGSCPPQNPWSWRPHNEPVQRNSLISLFLRGARLSPIFPHLGPDPGCGAPWPATMPPDTPGGSASRPGAEQQATSHPQQRRS